jgi:hypothetical protein
MKLILNDFSFGLKPLRQLQTLPQTFDRLVDGEPWCFGGDLKQNPARFTEVNGVEVAAIPYQCDAIARCTQGCLIFQLFLVARDTEGDMVDRTCSENSLVGQVLRLPGAVEDVDVKRLISAEVKAMAGRVREAKGKPDDVDGSTFSTSNLGMYDVDEFIAIINPPGSAILAIGSAREVLIVEGGQLKPGWRMKATIFVDPRVSDGAEAAQFIQALAGFLESPVRMLV